MMINSKVIGQITESADSLLNDYTKEIEIALAGEGMVTISLPIKIKQNGLKLDIEVGIGFVKERVKDAVNFVVDEQKELFDPRESSGNVGSA